MLRLKDDSEIVLMSSPSSEELYKIFETKVTSYFYTLPSNHVVGVDFSCLTSYTRQLLGWVEGQSFNLQLDTETLQPYSNFDWDLTIQLDHQRGQIQWYVGNDPPVVSPLPASPLYLVFVTGSSSSGASIIPHSNKNI